MVSVIVEFMPISHNPDTLAENRKIKHDSGIGEGMLISTRWIKPEQRRASGQRVMHLIACFQTTEAANCAIQEGVVIAGKMSWARRLHRELRCLKCQSLNANHLAAACGHPNTCGMCGKEHRTSECTEEDSDKYWCTNCKVLGHASWDRLFPGFVQASKHLEH